MSTPAPKPTVLIVDDVAAMRLSLASAFEAHGWTVSLAENGAEALEHLRSSVFDVILTDIWMPTMDGLSLLKAMRDRHPSLLVIAMTGGGPKLTTEVATSIAEVWGAEDVLLKPFNEDELVRRLSEQVRARAGTRP